MVGVTLYTFSLGAQSSFMGTRWYMRFSVCIAHYLLVRSTVIVHGYAVVYEVLYMYSTLPSHWEHSHRSWVRGSI